MLAWLIPEREVINPRVKIKTFDIIYVLTSGGPGILTRTLNLYAFKHGIEFLSMGYAGSIAIVMLLITIVVAQIFLRKNKLLTPKETMKQ